MLLMVEVLVVHSLYLQICYSSIKNANEINCNFIFLDYNSNWLVHNLQASELEKLANQAQQLCNGSILTIVKM